jgi:hypothetical protein
VSIRVFRFTAICVDPRDYETGEVELVEDSDFTHDYAATAAQLESLIEGDVDLESGEGELVDVLLDSSAGQPSTSTQAMVDETQQDIQLI